MLQFWVSSSVFLSCEYCVTDPGAFQKLTIDPTDPTAVAQVDFVGQSTRLNSTKYYVTDFTGDDGSRIAQSKNIYCQR